MLACVRAAWRQAHRMFSMRMEMCSAPRPDTMKESAVSPGSTRSARFRSSSLSSRSLMLRLPGVSFDFNGVGRQHGDAGVYIATGRDAVQTNMHSC
jgi:hypothetical protein